MAKFPEVYHIKEWKQVRGFVIARSYGLCERCKLKGIIKAGKEVE